MFYGGRNVPNPSLKRILLIYHAFWNTIKSGSDTTKKLMNNCVRCPLLPHSNCKTKASSRILVMLFVLFHRLNGILTSKHARLRYASLENFRKATSQHSTFHKTLLQCAHLFNDLSCDLEDDTKEKKVSKEPRICTKVFGVVLEVLDFAATATLKKTKRNVRERME